MIQDATLDNSAIIKGLNPNTKYEVSIAAGTDMGYGPGSEPEEAQTDEDGWCCYLQFLRFACMLLFILFFFNAIE